MSEDWQIIKQTSVQGVVEYSVSDGVVGQRTFSYNFSTLAEAKEYLQILLAENHGD
jgi:hypothetical protein